MGAWTDRRIRIFLSSTFEDLKEERHQVLDALMSLPRVRPVNMEHFGARPQKPIDVCLDEVSKSHVLVLIIGSRYGSMDESGRSFIEREYDKATEMGLPCYVYILPDKSAAKGEAPKRKQFIEKVKSRHTFYKPLTANLGMQVTADLAPIVGMTDVEDACDMLRLLSFFDSLFTRAIAEDLFRTTRLPSDSVFQNVNKLRTEGAWYLLWELGIPKHIRDDKFTLDKPLCRRLRQHMLGTPSLRIFPEQFVDYHLALLDKWTSDENVVTRELAGKAAVTEDEKLRYRAALEVAERFSGKEERIIKLTQGLVGTWQKTDTAAYWRNGLLVDGQQWSDALYSVQAAKRYAQRYASKVVLADLDYAEAYIYARIGKNRKALQVAKRVLPVYQELRYQDDLQKAKFLRVHSWVRQLGNKGGCR